jgi:dolichol-phosphate mannosyltransferase
VSAPRAVSVVVPLFDEEQNVLPLAGELRGVLEACGIEFELILVDDGSRDETRKRVLELAERCPNVRLVALARNAGQSAALLAGIRAARFAHVATLDGDLQNDPADLPRLIAQAARFDVVIGRRSARRDPFMRRVAGRVANAALRAVLRDRASDTGCALRVFPAAAYLALPRFDGMHRFLPALFASQGLSVHELDVNHRARFAGRSKYTNLARLRRGLLDLFGVWWLARRALRVEPDRGR